MTAWLLTTEIFDALANAKCTAAQLSRFIDSRLTAESSSQLLRTTGEVAEIRIEGILTTRPDLLVWLLGAESTTYAEIMDALAAAQADPAIKRVALYVDSPGGQLNGLFETLAAIEAFGKPISVRAAQACSAAYALAAAAGPITATSLAAEFGSIGVLAKLRVNDDEVVITSTHAPNKRPDPATDAGKAVLVEYLDAVHTLFAEAIARGRGTTTKTVNAEFGRGATLLAQAAKQRGLIDAVAGASTASSASQRQLAAQAQRREEFGNAVADALDRLYGKVPPVKT